MIVKLGQIYQTRDGKPVYIVRIFPKGWRDGTIYRVMGYVGDSTKPKYWTVKGKYFSVSVHSLMDLVPREINLDLPEALPLKKKATRNSLRVYLNQVTGELEIRGSLS